MADLTITAANVLAASGATTYDATAGDTITRGQAVYLDSADSNKAKRARANAATTDEVKGVALQDVASGQPLRIITGGDLNIGATLVVGKVYVLSAAAAGGVAPVDDLVTTNYVSVIGVASTASNLQVKLNNSAAQVP